MTPSRFRLLVRQFWEKEGRDLPWRRTQDPYAILVSEVMLQQTQVSRVVPKFEEFMQEFPTVKTLVKTPLSRVLTVWQGLGYNRRALYLKQASELLRAMKAFPTEERELRKLPGVGVYTARAVRVFAYNLPEVLVETNTRSVVISKFYPAEEEVSDKQVAEVLAQAMDRQRPREWYWGIMDWGSKLKTEGIRGHRRSVVYRQQSRFGGSRRELRGKVLELLLQRKRVKGNALEEVVRDDRLREVLAKMAEEGLIEKRRGKWQVKGEPW